MLLNTPAATLNGSSNLDILLIHQDPETTLYRDEILRHAGFRVTVLTTAEASVISDQAIVLFSVVVLSDSISAEDLFAISARVRRNSPRTKIVLIEDADCYDFDPALSDITLDRIDGVAGLISAVRNLTSRLV
jgi:PleD family two-component response regulator